MESYNGQWYYNGSVCCLCPTDAEQHQPAKQHQKAQHGGWGGGVWQGTGVLNIQDAMTSFKNTSLTQLPVGALPY